MLPQIGGFGIQLWRTVGQLMSNELVVIVSEHEIKLDMVNPDKVKNRNWDSRLFVSGNIYLEGYANPVKPIAKTERYSKIDASGEIEVSDRIDNVNLTPNEDDIQEEPKEPTEQVEDKDESLDENIEEPEQESNDEDEDATDDQKFGGKLQNIINRGDNDE